MNKKEKKNFKKSLFLLISILIFTLTGCESQPNILPVVLPSSNSEILDDSVQVDTQPSNDEIDENEVFLLGRYAFKKNIINKTTRHNFTHENYIISLKYNNEFEYYQNNKEMELNLKQRGYKNFYSGLTQNTFGNNISFNTYHKIIEGTNPDNTPQYTLNYLIVVKTAKDNYEVLSFEIQSERNSDNIDDYISLSVLVNQTMFLNYIEFEKHDMPDYSERNQNSYITEEEIFKLISNQYILNTVVFGEEINLPLDFKTSTNKEIQQGFIRIDIDHSSIKSMSELIKLVESTWVSSVSNNLLYENNGKTSYFKRNEQGGTYVFKEAEKVNPFYFEKDGIFYSSALIDYNKDSVKNNSYNEYSVEISRADETHCLINKWYRNPHYGDSEFDNYETEFLCYRALLLKEDGLWKFAYISLDYDELYIVNSYSENKDNPEKCYSYAF